jgi:ankyrin repeat protein
MNHERSSHAEISDFERQAETLLSALKSGDNDAAWRFKWEHPRFGGKTIDEVRAATPDLDLDDARLVVAQQQSFDTWADLVTFVDAVSRPGSVSRFEAAVDAVVSGDLDALQSMLREHPALTRERSTRRHHATLLHYIAANGVEGDRQKTPANAVAIANALLDAGAEVDALADMYEHKCTTMSMLVSSAHPHDAGLQIPLAEALLDHGAVLDGVGTNWQSAVLTALQFGYLPTAELLVSRGGVVQILPVAAGLGRLDDVKRLLPGADGHSRHAALALAAQHGHADVVRLLLDAGEDPSRYNPDGFHSHTTPLHQAVWADHLPVVSLLIERGARLDVRDTVYQATPLGWAIYGERTRIADFLHARGAPR